MKPKITAEHLFDLQNLITHSLVTPHLLSYRISIFDTGDVAF